MAETSPKTEKIGNIVLDLSHYPGEDFYCDGSVEDELLEIVKTTGEEDFGKVIEERKSWPVLYHLSPIRENIINWLPIKKNAKVLEVGSGCGAITGALSKKAGTLTCIELSKKRSLINAYRHKDLDNVTIRVGNFQDIESGLDTDYDYIFLIGVFEYARGYIDSKDPYGDFLKILKKHLKAEGKMAIAIENKYGLKYFAGCREDHLGSYFSGVEDYPDGGVVRTFGRKRLERMLKEQGFGEYSFYYPYPDYKFPMAIYSDRRLPQEGELTQNLRNFDGERLLLFDEKKAWDGAIKEEAFPFFSNSYFLWTGAPEEIVFSKFSNERSEIHSIRTDILEKEDGSRRVEKIALTDKAKDHLQAIWEDGQALAKRYEGSGLKVCLGERMGERTRLGFPYIEGKTLENILDELVKSSDYHGITEKLNQYYTFADYNSDAPVTDLDMIFPNILIDGNGWHLIDYEWTLREKRPVEEVCSRALFCYLQGGGDRDKLKEDLIFEKIKEALHLTDYDEVQLRWSEEAFQSERVKSGVHTLSDLRDEMDTRAIPLPTMLAWDKIHIAEHLKKRARFYFDRGDGFKEEDSLWIRPEEMPEDSLLTAEIEVDGDVKMLRFDPTMYSCMFLLESLEECKEGKEAEVILEKKLIHNGKRIGKGLYVFYGEDPNIAFALKDSKGEGKKKVRITYRVSELADSMAKHWKRG